MNLLQAVKYLRVYILNDTGGTGNNWSATSEGSNGTASRLLWSNEELTVYITEAQNEIARRCNLFEDFGSTFDVSIVAGTAVYTYHPKILQIIGNILNSNGKELELTDMRTIFESSRWDTQTGTPTKYAMNYKSKQIFFYPTPIASDTFKPFVYRLPLTAPSWTSNTVDLEVPDEYGFKMLWWAAFLAYMKSDVDTYDPKQAEKFKSLFDAEFEETSAYADTRKRRTGNRTVKYGGVGFSPIHSTTLLSILRNSNG